MHSFAIIYILLALYVVILLFADSKQKVIGNKEYAFISLSFFFLMFFHVFVDPYSVEDLYRYEDMYNDICNSSFSSALETNINIDYIWAIINKIASFVSHDFTFMLFLYNSILLCTVFIITNKYSPYIPVSILMFVLLTYDQSLFVLRQYLATAFVLMSIPFIINKKFIPYLALCIVACLCHKSSIIWMPLFFLCNIKNTKLYTGIIVVAIVIIGFICSNPLVLAVFFNDYYMNYLDGGNPNNITQKLIALTYLLCYILFAGPHILDNGINKLAFTMLLIYTAIFCFAPPVGIITRVLKYFELSLLFVVPITMSYINNKPIRVIYLLSILFLQGYLFIRGLNESWISDYRLQEISLTIFLLIFTMMLLLVMHIKKTNKAMLYNNFRSSNVCSIQRRNYDTTKGNTLKRR